MTIHHAPASLHVGNAQGTIRRLMTKDPARVWERRRLAARLPSRQRPYLEDVLASLVAAGLVSVTRGPRGGLRYAPTMGLGASVAHWQREEALEAVSVAQARLRVAQDHAAATEARAREMFPASDYLDTRAQAARADVAAASEHLGEVCAVVPAPTSVEDLMAQAWTSASAEDEARHPGQEAARAAARLQARRVEHLTSELAAARSMVEDGGTADVIAEGRALALALVDGAAEAGAESVLLAAVLLSKHADRALEALTETTTTTEASAWAVTTTETETRDRDRSPAAPDAAHGTCRGAFPPVWAAGVRVALDARRRRERDHAQDRRPALV